MRASRGCQSTFIFPSDQGNAINEAPGTCGQQALVRLITCRLVRASRACSARERFGTAGSRSAIALDDRAMVNSAKE